MNSELLKKLLTLAAIFVIASSSFVNAQSQEPLTHPSGSPSNERKLKYVLEIYVVPQFGPAYLSIGGPKGTPGWGLFHRFIRTGEAETGRLPIRGVKIEPQFKGEAVNVRVSLLRGEDGSEEEEMVHVYQLLPGDEQTLTHLRQFGIEPFRVNVVDTAPPLPPVPDFQSFTKSIEVVSAKRLRRPLPAYKLTLRNLSDKIVSALKVDVTRDGAEGASVYPEEAEGRPLIEPRGTTDVYLRVEVPVRNTSSYVPGIGASYTINVRSVVFRDLSFEGEVERACWFESQAMGRRIWLKRILAFLDQELANSNFDDQLEAAKQFKNKVAALRFKVDENERTKPSSIPTGCAPPAKPAISTARGMNLLLPREVDLFFEKGAAQPGAFKSWLEKKRVQYSAWLARLEEARR